MAQPLLLLLALTVSPLAAQQQGVKRALPGAARATCAPLPAASPVSERQQSEARRLASRAQQALIVGDNPAARDLYRQASRLDPQNADISYSLARALEASGDPAAAVAEYCRFLALAPGAPEVAEVRERLAGLSTPASPAISEQALLHFRSGVAHFDRRDFLAADAAFGSAIQRAPDWPEPYYNRAVSNVALGEPARAIRDFERYLALRPEAGDRAQIVSRVNGLRGGLLHPSRALVQGLVVPGFGQYYTRRPLLGVAVLAVAGGAAYWSLRKETKIETRTLTGIDPFGNAYEYTDDVIVTQRPNLVLGLAAAGGVTLLGALEAYLNARSESGAARETLTAPRRSTLLPINASPLLAPAERGWVLGLRLEF